MNIRSDCLAASRKALNWAADRIGGDGKIRDSEDIVFGYYKGPVALASAGMNTEAERLIRRLRSHFFRDGTFDRTDSYPTSTVGPAYRDSWIAWGAHMTGAYDLSTASANHLQASLDPLSGGAFAQRGDQPGAPIDWGITCVVMTSLMAQGQFATAIKGGELILNLLDNQPSPTTMLFFRWSAQQGFIKPSAGMSSDAWTINFSGEKQIYWYLGFALVLFGRLYRATGAAKWLRGAEDVLTLVGRCNKEVMACTSNGKIAWGAAEVYRSSGDKRFALLAENIASWICSVQRADGTWIRSAQTDAVPVLLDASFERSYYLNEVARAFA